MVLEAGDVYPSGVVRGLAYQPLLERDGYEVRSVSRLWPVLRRALETPRAVVSMLLATPLAGALFRLERFLASQRERWIARVAARYDVIYLCKVTSPALVRRLRARTRARLILDFGDALWLRSRRNDGFMDMLKLVDEVTTDNEWTARHVRTVRTACRVIPDWPPTELFEERRRKGVTRHQNDAVRLGWVGTPGTTCNLFVAWEALERLFAERPNLHLRLVGADPRLLPPFENVVWSLKTRYTQAEMIDEVLAMDVGLFPLQNVEAARVRGVLKAAVYMAGGVAVVGSPVGQFGEFVRVGIDGIFASTADEWYRALDRLVTDAGLRQRLAAGGLTRVRAEFSKAGSYTSLRSVLDPGSSTEEH